MLWCCFNVTSAQWAARWKLSQPAFSFCAASKTFGVFAIFWFFCKSSCLKKWTTKTTWKMVEIQQEMNDFLGFLDLRNLFVFWCFGKGYAFCIVSGLLHKYMVCHGYILSHILCYFNWIFHLWWKIQVNFYHTFLDLKNPPWTLLVFYPPKKNQATVGTHGHPPGFPSQLSSRKWEIPIHWFEGDK